MSRAEKKATGTVALGKIGKLAILEKMLDLRLFRRGDFMLPFVKPGQDYIKQD
jgi:hypothetical protein